MVRKFVGLHLTKGGLEDNEEQGGKTKFYCVPDNRIYSPKGPSLTCDLTVDSYQHLHVKGERMRPIKTWCNLPSYLPGKGKSWNSNLWLCDFKIKAHLSIILPRFVIPAVLGRIPQAYVVWTRPKSWVSYRGISGLMVGGAYTPEARSWSDTPPRAEDFRLDRAAVFTPRRSGGIARNWGNWCQAGSPVTSETSRGAGHW